MIVESFAVGPLECNCSIVADEAAKLAIVVNPGGDFDEIREKLNARGLSVVAIVHTHTHINHVGATAPLQRLTGARACIHESDRFLYDMLPVQAALVGCEMPEKTEMEGSLKDGSAIVFGAGEMGVLHTPGHTPGSVTFVVKDGAATHVFAGDTLFRRGIGRTISGGVTRRRSCGRSRGSSSPCPTTRSWSRVTGRARPSARSGA